MLKYFLAGLLVILILLIGFSRIYLRVHYFSDVIAGFIIGLLWLYVSLVALNRAEKYLKEKRTVDLPTAQVKKRPANRSTERTTVFISTRDQPVTCLLLFPVLFPSSPPSYHQR